MESETQRLYQRARKRIPGATQLLSKRAEQFAPGQWPAYYSKAKGVEVWDLDGRKYVDMSLSGIGSCVLGFADPDVNAAVEGAIRAGSMCTQSSPEEVELADLLCELHPWAEMVRYGRGGGEGMAIAVRAARAATGRDKVAFCGYHGWHDWYLAANLAEKDALVGHLMPGLQPAGVPRGLLGTAMPFHYNKIEELEAIVADHGKELAAIVMEPRRSQEPQPGFLEKVRKIATDNGAVLIFDEVSCGFRLNTGGLHMVYKVTPDIVVFAKAMSNGYPMAAIVGRASVMEAFQISFISSTYWTERIGPTAALATIRKHQRCNVPKHLAEIGTMMQNGWLASGERAGLKISVEGMPAMSHFAFEHENAQTIRTLFTQLMLERGFLTTSGFYANYAHQPSHVESYFLAVDEAFAIIAKAIERNEVESLLKGPAAHTGFYRLT